MNGLHIAPELTLPVDAVTGTFGILATKGAGKSNAAVVMAEEMYDAGVPWVAIDPKGDWWGLRSNADGTGPGLPIVVFGGRHGDVPLEPTAGALLADLVLEQGLTCVLDVSQFTKADTTRFLLAFGRRLFAHADDGDGPEPLHLFLEEAHEYLPQVVKGDQADLVNVWQRIVKQGRFKGLGCTLISQRSSVLNKDVLELIDTLIVLRTIGPNSRKSIAGWVADQDVDTGLMASLPSLDDGEAWLWSPGALSILERIRFRRRRTFDSGATPKVGQKRRTPATLADVDLAVIKEQMAETIEKAKADDPKVLRARVRDLEQQLATEQARQPEPVEPVVQVVHVPVVTAEVLSDFTAAAGPLAELLTSIGAELERLADQPVPDAGVQTSLPSRRRADAGTPPVVARQPGRAAASARPGPSTRAPQPPAGQGNPNGVKLGSTERNVITVLAEHGASTNDQIALLAGYSKKASTVGVALSKLRKAGYVTDGQPCEATAEGLEWLGDYEPLPTGQALVDYWRGRFGKTEKAVLDAFLELYPTPADHATVCQITGYSPDASTVGVAASKLRKVGVIDGWQLSPQFVQGGAL